MECAGCRKPILDQFALNVIDRYFHDECLKCSCCLGPLADLSRICYYREKLLFCMKDYMRLFGKFRKCAQCLEQIAPIEYVIMASSNSYHLDCFSCVECGERFCVGDTFYLNGTKVYCPNDYQALLKASV